MLYFIFLLLFIFIGINKGKSNIIFWCLCFLIFIIANHTTSGNDITNYEIAYNNPLSEEISSERSVIWSALNLMLRNLGVTFYEFRILCFLIWAISIIGFIKKYAKYPTYVLAVCSLFPILSFSSQIRNAISIAFVYIAIRFLLKDGQKWISLFFLLIAGFIHYIAFFYIVIYLTELKIRTSSLLKCSLIFAFISIFLISSGLLYNLLSISLGYYADFYFAGEKEFVAPINYIVYISAIFINLYYSVVACKNTGQQIINGTNVKRLCRFVSRLNVISVAAIPLLFVSLSFFRIYQNIIILTAITLSNMNSNYQKTQNLRLAYATFILFLAMFFFYGSGEFLTSIESIKF